MAKNSPAIAAVLDRCPFEVRVLERDGQIVLDAFHGERDLGRWFFHKTRADYFEPMLLADMVLAQIYYQAVHGEE